MTVRWVVSGSLLDVMASWIDFEDGFFTSFKFQNLLNLTNET